MTFGSLENCEADAAPGENKFDTPGLKLLYTGPQFGHCMLK